MELKKRTKTVHFVDAHDLAKYLGEKIGRSVDILDTPNDTDYSTQIEKGQIDDYDKKSVDNFLKKGWISMDYGYNAVFTHCANEGWIEEGEYVIQVCW